MKSTAPLDHCERIARRYKTGRVAPAELDIDLVLDSYATHKAPSVKAWLAHHPRYHLYFTPTSTSWLHQVERWFALLAKQSERGVHRIACMTSSPPSPQSSRH
jgi:hypothetical protein